MLSMTRGAYLGHWKISLMENTKTFLHALSVTDQDQNSDSCDLIAQLMQIYHVLSNLLKNLATCCRKKTRSFFSFRLLQIHWEKRRPQKHMFHFFPFPFLPPPSRETPWGERHHLDFIKFPFIHLPFSSCFCEDRFPSYVCILFLSLSWEKICLKGSKKFRIPILSC